MYGRRPHRGVEKRKLPTALQPLFPSRQTRINSSAHIGGLWTAEQKYSELRRVSTQHSDHPRKDSLHKRKMNKCSGFWQVDLTPNTQELLALITTPVLKNLRWGGGEAKIVPSWVNMPIGAGDVYF